MSPTGRRSTDVAGPGVGAAPDGFVGLDAERRVHLVNALAEAMLGCPRERLVGRQVEALLHPGGGSVEVLFTERRTTVRLRLPAGGGKPVRLVLGRGRLQLDLRGFGPAARLDVEVDEGEARVLGGEALRDGRVTLAVRRGQVTEEPAPTPPPSPPAP